MIKNIFKDFTGKDFLQQSFKETSGVNKPFGAGSSSFKLVDTEKVFKELGLKSLTISSNFNGH